MKDLKKKLICANHNEVDFRFGLGTAGLSGLDGGFSYGEVGSNQAETMIYTALEKGMNLIDSAPIYGFSSVEKKIGNLKFDREASFLMSKCGVTWHSNKRVDLNNDPKVCEKMLETTLRDMKTDYIDGYFIHHPDPRVDIRSTMEVLAKAKMDQKIRYIGLSNTTEQEFKLASEVDTVDLLQEKFHFFWQDFAHEKNKNFEEPVLITYGTLDQGVLTGRVYDGRVYEKCDHRSFAPSWKKRKLKNDLEKVSKLAKFIEKEEFSMFEVALGSCLQHPNVDYSLIGLKEKEDIHKFFESLEKLPNSDQLKQLEQKSYEF